MTKIENAESNFTEIEIVNNKNKNYIVEFTGGMEGYLNQCGLPLNVLSPLEERTKIMAVAPEIITKIDVVARDSSKYLSKFIVCAAAGLFDAALNYLWDEFIKALKQRIIDYDIEYFISVAKETSSRYKSFSSGDDLSAISDYDLLEICRKIGLLTDVEYKSFEYINYMRNHTSAAHPNDNELTGFKMIDFMETCIERGILAEIDHSVIQMKQLFKNIRENVVPDEDIKPIIDDLGKQNIERIEGFLQSLFGMYCDIDQEEKVYKNIEKLAPGLWKLVGKDIKYRIGSKFGYYRKNADIDRKNQCQKFLEAVAGLSYKDEDSLIAELLETIQDLRSAHFSLNNFYFEYAYAINIKNSLPVNGIPEAIRKLFVKVISLCYIGNGCGYKEGVDERAIPYYEEFISRFGDPEISELVKLFFDQEFVTDMYKRKVEERTKKLCRILKEKTKSEQLIAVLDYIINYNDGNISNIGTNTLFETLVKDCNIRNNENL